MDLDLLPFLAVTALVMAVPGPSVLYAVSQRLERGRVAGVVAVLGLETGLLVHVLAACLGVSALIAASPSMLGVLRYAGAGYLVVLGLRQLGFRLPWQSLSRLSSRSTGPPPPPLAPAVSPTSARGGTILAAPVLTEQTVRLWPVFRTGLLVDLLNPKTVLFFLALLPQFVPGGALTAAAAVVMVICVVGLGLAFDGGYAALAGGLQRRGLTALGRWARPVAGCCFLTLAVAAILG